MQKRIIVILFIFISGLAICGIAAAVFNWNRYKDLRDTIESANDGELQRQLGAVTAELERTKSALAESEESVGRLEELDQRRDAGIKRIGGIIDDAGKSVSGVESGERRARIAFEAIARIVDILESEFSGGAK